MRILAVLNRRETARAVLVAAGRLRAALPDGRIDVLHPRPDVDPSFMPTEEIWTDARRHAFEAQCDALLRELQGVFEEWRTEEPQSAGLQLRQAVGKVETTIGAEAARADLVVLGSVGAAHDPDARQAIETALVDAAAPILLVPETLPASLGRRVAVAWEGSRAADEAVGAALPLLLVAGQVTILMAEERHGRASLPSRMLQALQQGGIPTRTHRFGLNGREIGTALLAEARSAAADLLVMGAFTHNRTIEALFGGATMQVLAGADLPVLMHH